MNMIVGFTGTRMGMTDAQKDAVLSLLKELKPGEVHHGCCIGADADFACLAGLDMDDRGLSIHAHPSTLKNMTDWEALAWSDAVHPNKSPLARNHDIVDASDLLIACPKEAEEQLRSGTWATVRYARKAGKPVKVILPDGTVQG